MESDSGFPTEKFVLRLWIEMVTAADRVIDMDSGFTTEKFKVIRLLALTLDSNFASRSLEGSNLPRSPWTQAFILEVQVGQITGFGFKGRLLPKAMNLP